MIEVYEYDRKTHFIYKPADDSHPSTGYYLTKEEYDSLTREIRSAEFKEHEAKSIIEKLKETHKSEIRQLKENHSVSMDELRYDIESKYETELFNAQEKIQKYKKAAEKEAELNRNFKRIARERANKKRNVNKHDPGYLILNWKPTTYNYKNDEGSSQIQLYMITIQTPWDCSLSLEEVDKLVVDDMQQSHIYMLPNGGTIYFLQNISLDKAIECAVENEYDFNRIILTRKYQSNVKSGLWEVAFITGFEPTINEHHRKTYV